MMIEEQLTELIDELQSLTDVCDVWVQDIRTSRHDRQYYIGRRDSYSVVLARLKQVRKKIRLETEPERER